MVEVKLMGVCGIGEGESEELTKAVGEGEAQGQV